MSLYLEYTCMKWIYHMRSYKYDWLKYIYIYIHVLIIITGTCTCIHFPGLYYMPEMWKLRLIRKTDFYRFFFWERLRTREYGFHWNIEFQTSLFYDMWYNIYWLFIFWRLAWSHAFIILSNFLMALPYVALHIFDPLVDL